MKAIWNALSVSASPLLQAIHPALERAAWPTQNWPGLRAYQFALDGHGVTNASGQPLRVVCAPEPASREWRRAYESRVYEQAALSTRMENVHDAFNVLAWCAFPQTKAALNARHHVLSCEAAVSEQDGRSAAQDALTQFDESGVIVASADAGLTALLKTAQWKQAFWHARDAVTRHLRCFVVGHGLMEKALNPYIGLTGKALFLQVAPDFMHLPLAAQVAHIDHLSAHFVASAVCWSQPRALLPLPLLGMPGFSEANNNELYYDNTAYFRPPRER